MKDKVKRFIENVGGNFVEVSYRQAEYQCFDLVYLFVFVLDIPKATIQNRYAYQIWTKPKSITKEYFDLLKNTSDFVPIAGDLAVYKGGEAGHVGVVANNDNDVNGFNIFEQNFPTGANPRIRRSSYNNILGFLRPRVQALPQPEPIIEDSTIIPQIIDEQGNAMEVQAVRGSLYDLRRDYKSLENSLESRINDAVEKTRAEGLRDCNERVKYAKATLKTECEDKLKEASLKYENMVFKKVGALSAFTLFGLGLKKLFRRTGK